MRLNVKLTDGAPLPKHAKPGDAGLDLTTRETVTLGPGETRMVGTGVAVEIPAGHFGLVVPRSGLGSRGVNLSNCAGVIDSGYRGEWVCAMYNGNPVPVHITKAVGEVQRLEDRVLVPYTKAICQFHVRQIPETEICEITAEEIYAQSSERGAGKLGSSGK